MTIGSNDSLCGPAALQPCATAGIDEPWCMPILRTEALLRLGDPYISATQVFFDAGGVPPPYLDEAVELLALQMHGVDPTEENLDAYRAAAQQLSLDSRAEIFFLHAN